MSSPTLCCHRSLTELSDLRENHASPQKLETALAQKENDGDIHDDFRR